MDQVNAYSDTWFRVFLSKPDIEQTGREVVFLKRNLPREEFGQGRLGRGIRQQLFEIRLLAGRNLGDDAIDRTAFEAASAGAIQG